MSHPATVRPSPAMPRATSYGMAAAAASGSPYAAQAARYRDAELLSASPGQLVVMLYDKMLVTLRRARAASEGGRIEERCESIVKVMDMVTELRLALDHGQGGEIAAQLDALYAFMLRELLEANRLQRTEKLDVVLRVAGELRDAFAQVVAAGAGALPKARIA